MAPARTDYDYEQDYDWDGALCDCHLARDRKLACEGITRPGEAWPGWLNESGGWGNRTGKQTIGPHGSAPALVPVPSESGRSAYGGQCGSDVGGKD